MTTTPVHEPDEILLGFTRALRAAGVVVTTDRGQEFLRAASLVGAGDPRATYWAGRATLCGGPDDLDRYDAVFRAWFDATSPPRPQTRETRPSTRHVSLAEHEAGGGSDEEDTTEAIARASSVEVLRHRDIADLTADELRTLARMFSSLHPRAPMRRTARHRSWHRGNLDSSRTLRATLRRMGEPAEIAWRRPTKKPRRVVLLLDVSGSMSAYADALLRFAQRFTTAVSGPVETFTVGTRLTRISNAMRLRAPERALIAAGDTVPDWSGGTRLGESLQAFTDRFGARGLARGAVVVVCSDGWERGDVALLQTQMARLHRLAHRVVWVNPHRGKPGYAPVQQGIAAVLPHTDEFLAGHSLATFAELTEVVADA